MNQTFTFKSVLIALLVMICCTAKATTVSYTTANGFAYVLDLETQEASINRYSGYDKNVVVPENVTYEGKAYKVTSLRDRCFKNCSSLVSVDIPSSVTSLGDECFSGCSSLVSVDIPSSVTSLGDYCFYVCSSLASIDIPSSVTSLGDYCFYVCSSLASVDIPSSVTSLGYACFAYCSSLASIVIPSSVTSLGDKCFNSCSSLVSIEIPSSVTSLGHQCFFFCTSLASVDIPSSVTSLGQSCFYDCSSLASIDIPSSVTSLGNLCFYGCSSLASIDIPFSVTNLGYACFAGCPSLETIVVDANNSRYDSREGCNAIIETASNTMIAGCKNTFIPSSVTSLGRSCFSNCSSLVSIDIPSSVTSLGYYCFAECSSLKTVICRMENAENDSFFTNGLIEDATLYVPESLLTTYQNTYPWRYFGTILPLTEEVELGIGNVPNSAVALRSAHGSVVLSGLADGIPVLYYGIDGRLLGRTSVDNGSASFSVRPNTIVTIKAGKQSFKVRVK